MAGSSSPTRTSFVAQRCWTWAVARAYFRVSPPLVALIPVFAARAGARKVYAVEASSLASKTRAIVAQNGLDDVVE